MPFSHPKVLRHDAVARVLGGEQPQVVARELGVSRTTVYGWVHEARPDHFLPRPLCWRCQGGATPDVAVYAYLLGAYLGDGCVSPGRTWVLRITCGDVWPGVADEVEAAVRSVSGRSVQRVRKAGAHDVQAWWQHWPCVIPQTGPGRKHHRVIALEPWQQALVDDHPGRFLRGLFHSDGWRGMNVAVVTRGGTTTRYRYPRYQFVNRSDDIRDLCCASLDRLGIAWRQSNRWTISVARRGAVAALDEHVGSEELTAHCGAGHSAEPCPP